MGSLSTGVNSQVISAGNSKYNAIDALRRIDGKERVIHIDDTHINASTTEHSSLVDVAQRQPSSNPLVSMTATEKSIVIVRKSGEISSFSTSTLTLDLKFPLFPGKSASPGFRIQKCSLNSSSSRLLLIDGSGIAKIVNMEVRSKSGNMDEHINDSERLIEFERKDVWDVKWATDNDDMFVTMEKTRLVIFNGLVPEDPVTCSGYLCSFSDLQVKVTMLDDILANPEDSPRDVISFFEAKKVIDVKNAVNEAGLDEAFQLVEQNPHQRLWKMLAETSLEVLDLEKARKAFIRSSDYSGLQLIQKLHKIEDRAKQQAEIASYFSNYDVCEKLYMDLDRKDLAIDLRVRLGDWFRVIQLLKSSGATGSADDAILDKIRMNIGDYYYDRQRWSQAISYYAQGQDMFKLAECYYHLEDYSSLEKLVYSVNDNSPVLKIIAEYFVSAGMSDQAVDAYLKLGDVKNAVDVCITLNQWNRAIELAKLHNFKDIEAKLAKYATRLQEKNMLAHAIELFRKARLTKNSAILLFQLARQSAKEGKGLQQVKKLYVLAAQEADLAMASTKNTATGGNSSPTPGAGKDNAASLLVSVDPESRRFLEKPWRGAEAYHYYMLAQRLFLSGHATAALKPAIFLKKYEDILDPRAVHSLIALVSYHTMQYAACSRSFTRLETLDVAGAAGAAEQRDGLAPYARLAFSVFGAREPVDVALEGVARVACPSCTTPLLETLGECVYDVWDGVPAVYCVWKFGL
ncbi:MAG: hypothetical protein SGCHY_002418 [Lobulomycetales sp.]